METVPVIGQDTTNLKAASVLKQAARRRITRILLIEDNPGDARLVHEMLKSEQYFGLSHVSNMSEGEIFLAEHRVDLVLLDSCL
ncbi:MAG TPA: hypothetical protein VN181_01810, partial [Thermoanaerobaculia bacterium]|nr:hypothetical protein [Thermoanaerobaculia bacterium]